MFFFAGSSTFPRSIGIARRLRGAPLHSPRWRSGAAPRAPACGACSAVVLSPKERPVWVMGSHRRTGGTLDKFKAAREGHPAHNGDLPKSLEGNRVPAAVADRRISLQPYAPGGRGWLVGHITSTTDRHRVLQAVDARTPERATGALRGSPAASRRRGRCPYPTPRSIDGARYCVIKAP